SLTWNANGTLQQMAIADNFNQSNAQTCSYGYDDLARLLSANCLPIWSQTFAYNSEGNIWKAGNVYFNLGYNGLNHVLTYTYDNNGNVTNDGSNSYSYDAEGRPVTAGGVQVFYDGFNRPMAKNNGGTYTQILYSPTGQRFALMSGGWAASGTYFVPLAAGLQAVYSINNAVSTLAYYRHADWLGSSRFAGTTSGTVYFDRAFAPFGETYAETGAADRSFTGQTQDEIAGLTGNYDFLFRQHSSAQGRWLVPDPAGLAAVDITNPQTWNRYAYVANNPLSFTDPLGLYCVLNVHACSPGAGWAGGGGFALLGVTGVGSGAVFVDGGCFGCDSAFLLAFATQPLGGGGDGQKPG